MFTSMAAAIEILVALATLVTNVARVVASTRMIAAVTYI